MYKVITAANERRLVEKVNEALEDGWELAGGPAFGNGQWNQAVTKAKPKATRKK